MWSGQGLASSLNCSAIPILEFQSAGNEPPISLHWGMGGICLFPQYTLLYSTGNYTQYPVILSYDKPYWKRMYKR